jgi:hypothetical protein
VLVSSVLKEQVQVKQMPLPVAWVTFTIRVQYERPSRMLWTL